jgi:hypothetical protein
VQKTYLGLCRGVLAEPLRVDHGVREKEVRRPLFVLRPVYHLSRVDAEQELVHGVVAERREDISVGIEVLLDFLQNLIACFSLGL